jgi:small subunit ribosomal protein S7
MGVFAMDDAPIIPEPPRPEISKPDFDNMHHHIPPAQNSLLHLFTNMIMRHGQYALAAKATSQTLLNIHALTRSPPMPIFEHAILTASPAVRCKRQKERGGKATMRPLALSERQRTRIGIDWIVKAANRSGNPGRALADRLAREILAVVKGTSPVLANKVEMHKVAMQNRGLLSKIR